MKKIITLKNLSKYYYYPARHEKTVKGIISSFLRREKFYALNDISLEIFDGDFIGIIGKNGAGKTILLKILAGIVFPSLGEVIIKKPVSPIFQYGAGFHEDLTGRENIFFYAALLGIKKDYVVKNFDYIVDFSELENFLDIKIRYFSIGMRVRLAFSVASLLTSDILLLDEALSIGDQSFVAKAHKKIKELQQNGVTTIITSHSLEIIRKFCKKGFVLNKGKLLFSGDINSSISYYEEEILNQKVQIVS